MAISDLFLFFLSLLSRVSLNTRHTFKVQNNWSEKKKKRERCKSYYKCGKSVKEDMALLARVWEWERNIFSGGRMASISAAQLWPRDIDRDRLARTFAPKPRGVILLVISALKWFLFVAIRLNAAVKEPPPDANLLSYTKKNSNWLKLPKHKQKQRKCLPLNKVRLVS